VLVAEDIANVKTQDHKRIMNEANKKLLH